MTNYYKLGRKYAAGLIDDFELPAMGFDEQKEFLRGIESYEGSTGFRVVIGCALVGAIGGVVMWWVTK